MSPWTCVEDGTEVSLACTVTTSSSVAPPLSRQQRAEVAVAAEEAGRAYDAADGCSAFMLARMAAAAESLTAGGVGDGGGGGGSCGG